MVLNISSSISANSVNNSVPNGAPFNLACSTYLAEIFGHAGQINILVTNGNHSADHISAAGIPSPTRLR